jgi:exonuclease SbcC
MRARLTAEAAAARARVDDFQRRRVELEAVQAALVALDRELVEWSFLAAATSRDGLPTLEIDAAGPLVSERANDLLATCYGSQRFTIEIVTQDARAKGGLKEVFEMKVWDATDSRHARDIGDLSGGEKILVDEAVKCALALHVNDHSRIAIRTCFRDETTSALYPDTALRYMTMLRRVHERGGFDHVFFVTHNPAVAAEADAQILVQGGRLTVTLPPYDAITWPQTAEATA